jgi:hypothetical protein
VPGEAVPVTGEVARFPAETLGTHKDGNTDSCLVFHPPVHTACAAFLVRA